MKWSCQPSAPPEPITQPGSCWDYSLPLNLTTSSLTNYFSPFGNSDMHLHAFADSSRKEKINSDNFVNLRRTKKKLDVIRNINGDFLLTHFLSASFLAC